MSGADQEWEWAKFGANYLKSQRQRSSDELNDIFREAKQPHAARHQRWYQETKDVVLSLYDHSETFYGDGNVPGDTFSSPRDFATKLNGYRAFLTALKRRLLVVSNDHVAKFGTKQPFFLVGVANDALSKVLDAVEYVISKAPGAATTPLTGQQAFGVVTGFATRFHESVVSLAKHPHGREPFKVIDEWDCQYLFRAILAAQFRDIRSEEWNPSSAGSSSRCEFFLKPYGIMVELKYVRQAGDHKKIKQELLVDLNDYGANPSVQRVVALIYDPSQKLSAAVQLQDDLSCARAGLEEVKVIVSPPR